MRMSYREYIYRFRYLGIFNMHLAQVTPMYPAFRVIFMDTFILSYTARNYDYN